MSLPFQVCRYRSGWSACASLRKGKRSCEASLVTYLISRLGDRRWVETITRNRLLLCNSINTGEKIGICSSPPVGEVNALVLFWYRLDLLLYWLLAHAILRRQWLDTELFQVSLAVVRVGSFPYMYLQIREDRGSVAHRHRSQTYCCSRTINTYHHDICSCDGASDAADSSSALAGI